MSKLSEVSDFLFSKGIDPDKVNIIINKESSSEITIWHYQLSGDFESRSLMRNLKKAFGPLKESGYNSSKNLTGSREISEGHNLIFTYYGAFTCEKVSDKVIELSDSDVSYKKREIERLQRELASGTRTEPVYSCTPSKVEIEL